MRRYLYYARSRRAALAAETTESKSMVEVTRQIAKEWAELKTAKDSVLDLLKPEALIKHEENIRQAAGKEPTKWYFRALKRIELFL